MPTPHHSVRPADGAPGGRSARPSGRSPRARRLPCLILAALSLGGWAWVAAAFWRVLHAPPRQDDLAYLAVSPDGSTLCFAAGDSVHRRLYLADRALSDVRRLPVNAGDVTSPAFLPDGKHIAFSVGESAQGPHHIEVCALDGGGRRRISEPGGARDVGPVISADGAKLAFIRARRQPGRFEVMGLGWTDHEVVEYDMATGKIWSLLPDSVPKYVDPVYSPDGRYLAVTSIDVGVSILIIDTHGERRTSSHPLSEAGLDAGRAKAGKWTFLTDWRLWLPTRVAEREPIMPKPQAYERVRQIGDSLRFIALANDGSIRFDIVEGQLGQSEVTRVADSTFLDDPFEWVRRRRTR